MGSISDSTDGTMSKYLGSGSSMTDTESIIQYTRTPKKAPEFKPRSRSLDKLPGGIRVNILQRPDSRVKLRLDAGREGLEELKLLREAQQRLVEDVTHDYHKEYEQTNHHRSPHSVPGSLLSSILEENLTDQNEERSSSCTSMNTDIPSPPRAITRHSETKLPIGIKGRRASIQIDSDYYKNCTTGSHPEKETSHVPSRFRSRRPSFQVDSIITERTHSVTTAQLISEMKLQYNFPGPMRAVMRQYGSSSTLHVSEKSKVTDTVRPSSNHLTTSTTNTKSCELKREPSSKPGENVNVKHSRAESSTSDYFGSAETIDSSVKSTIGIPTVSRTESFSEFGNRSLRGRNLSWNEHSKSSMTSSDLVCRHRSQSENSDEVFSSECQSDDNSPVPKPGDSESRLHNVAKSPKLSTAKRLLETSL